MEDEKKPCGGEFVIPSLPGPDGSLSLLHHHADHSVTVDHVRSVEEGENISGEEVFRLVAREDGPGFRKETLYDGRKGPAKVNSAGFRNGWDAVFGKKDSGTSAPN